MQQRMTTMFWSGLVGVLVAGMVTGGCGAREGSDPAVRDAGAELSDAGDVDAGCSDADVYAQIKYTLATLVTDTDFSLLVRSADGRSLMFQRGTSTVITSYPSASTSKWVTAMVILDLVEQGILSLDDQPQDYIDFWTTEPSEPLSQITLSHLLSFTSGLQELPLCTNIAIGNFRNCTKTIHDLNLGKSILPGSAFYYESTHMQVAGLMAVEATGLADWSAVFESFKARTGLFPNGIYDLPSTQNPRLAGGMHWRGTEYIEFLQAFFEDKILSPALKEEVLKDHIGAAVIGYTPAKDGWRYAYGFWLECDSPNSECSGIATISSPGAFGAYPFIDYDNAYYGIVARKGAFATAAEGEAVFDAVRDNLAIWASGTCD